MIGHATPEELRPSREEAARDEQNRPPMAQLPDPRVCIDPWCEQHAAGRHLHGTRPDGRRV